MKLPPAWKIRREIKRVAEQFEDLLVPRVLERLQQFGADRGMFGQIRQTQGALPLTPRVAVFVLFQPKGLAASTFLTLKHLAQENWSVVVVSNAVLSEADRQAVARLSACVIERSNFGYDFGAYRQGWRWLDAQSVPPERLILMNDSTWFPLSMQDGSLRRMEALDVDLTGHVLKTEDQDDPRQDHVESHLLMLGPRALSSAAFAQFKRSYVMSSLKRRTIAYGEKGLTQTLRAAGLTVRGLVEKADVLQHFCALTPDAFGQDLKRLALHRPEHRAWREELLASAPSDPRWMDKGLAWIAQELANSRQVLISAAFLDVGLSVLGLGYVKKSPDTRFQLGRLSVLRAVAEGRLTAIDPVVLSEIQQVVSAWQPVPDWRARPDETQITEL